MQLPVSILSLLDGLHVVLQGVLGGDLLELLVVVALDGFQHVRFARMNCSALNLQLLAIHPFLVEIVEDLVNAFFLGALKLGHLGRELAMLLKNVVSAQLNRLLLVVNQLAHAVERFLLGLDGFPLGRVVLLQELDVALLLDLFNVLRKILQSVHGFGGFFVAVGSDKLGELFVEVVDGAVLVVPHVVGPLRFNHLEFFKHVPQEVSVVLSETFRLALHHWRLIDHVQDVVGFDGLGWSAIQRIKIDDLNRSNVVKFKHKVLAVNLERHGDLGERLFGRCLVPPWRAHTHHAHVEAARHIGEVAAHRLHLDLIAAHLVRDFFVRYIALGLQ